MTHETPKSGANFPEIQEELARLQFSREAELSQLILDWSRLKENMFLNNQPVIDLFRQKGIDTEDMPDTHDRDVQKKFNDLLSELVPTQSSPDATRSAISQLPTILHQGGLLFNLEHQLVKKITEQGLSLDNVKKGMERRTFVNKTDTGFAVKEIFSYNGNISKQDPDSPEFKQEHHKKPMLTGVCQYDVTIDHTGLHPTLTDFNLVSPVEKVEQFLGKKNSIDLTKDIKQKYRELRNNDLQSNSNEITPPYSPTNDADKTTPKV